MTTGNTTLLGLALPVQGELDGTWGDVVNQQITELLDTAVAGTTTLNTDADVTLTTTVLAANQARQAVLLWTANGTTTRNITAPAQSKAYIVINASAGTQSIVVRGAGPTTGVTIIKGERALVAWNGSDFVKIGSTSGAGTFTDLTVTGNTILGDAAGDTITVNGATTFVNVSPTITPGTANGVAYLNGSKVLTTGSALTFDGTNLATNGSFSTGDAQNISLNASSSGQTNRLQWKYGGTAYAWIERVNSTGDMAFGVQSSEAMRLTSTGLGIGTSSPTTQFVVSNAGALGIEITGSNGSIQAFNRSTSAYGTMNLFANTLYFRTGVSPALNMALDSSGNLGIGTSSPSSAYSGAARVAMVAATSTNAASLRVSSANASAELYSAGASTEWGLYSASNSPFKIWTNNNVAATIDSSGNLGIGTSSPGYPLQVRRAGGAGSLGITVDSVGSINRVAQYYSIGDTTAVTTGHAWYTRNASATDNLSLLLDNSGNLGLGVTPSAWSGGKWMQFVSTTAVGQQGNGTANLMCNAYESSGNNFSYIASVGAARYNVQAGTHAWFTAPSGTAGNAISFTQAMTLDSSGNLQLGATSGSGNRLNVVGSGGIRVNEDGSGTKVITIRSDFAGVGPAINVTTNDPLLFQTNNTERARITSGGVLLVGTTSAPTIAGVTTDHAFVAGTGGRWVTGFRNTTTGTPWGLAVEYSGAAPNDTSSNFLYCYDSAPALRMNVRSNGGIANYSANDVNLSDRREKTNLAPAKSYLDTICAIPVQTFNYIDQSENDPGLTLGVVAQDVQAVAPELVMESNWGTEDNPKMRLSIYQTDLQYALMKALQELKAEFDAYKATHP